MKPGELELFSTAELIDELLRRTTFQGVIVHSREDAKTRVWHGGRVFNVRFNANLDPDEVGRLLEAVGQYIARIG